MRKISLIQTEMIPLSAIEQNQGQIDGLPANPRLIRDEKFEKLKKSIQDLPEMTEARGLLVYPHNGKYVVIGGNMRLRVYQALGWKEAPCCILPESMPVDKLREIVIQDNNPFGETDWDMIANEWNVDQLKDWGMDLPKEWDFDDNYENDKSSLELKLGNEKTELRILFNTDTYARVIEALRVFDENEDVALLKALGLYEE